MGAASRQTVNLRDDKDSPDLIAVAEHIARTDDLEAASERSQALLAVLRRAWTARDASWRSQFEVNGTFFYWRRRPAPGSFPSRWRSRIADIQWLVTAGGDRVSPRDASLRTPELMLVEGEAPHHVVVDDPDEQFIELAAALDIRITPETSLVIERLKELRQESATSRVGSTVGKCYRILASRIPEDRKPTTMVGDLSVNQIRGHFGFDPDRQGLVWCQDKWLVPSRVVIGSHGFGRRRGAVPDREETRPLWDLLGITEEDAHTANRVLQELADSPLEEREDKAAMVQALRFLASTPPADRPRLDDLPVWCGDRWVDERPVFSCSHPTIAAAVREELPVWDPECDPASLGDLPKALGITPIDVSDRERVVLEHDAHHDEYLTDIFRESVGHFRNLLERHEPYLFEQLAVEWEQLEGASVATSLEVRARVEVAGSNLQVDLPVVYDPDQGVVVSDRARSLLEDPETAMGLLVSCYESEPGQLAPLYRASLYWGQGWREAESGRHITPLGLERTDPVDLDPEDDVVLPERARPRPAAREHKDETAPDPGARRGSRLKRPGSISLVREPPDPEKPSDRSSRTSKRTNRGAPPRRISVAEAPEPRRDRGGARTSGQVEDTEELGWQVVESILRDGDDPTVRDLRRRRDVGADGYDIRRDKAIELKAYRGPVPDTVNLQNSQIREARIRRHDYWLFVVGGLSDDSTTEVHLIADPLAELQIGDQPSVRLSGVLEARTLAVWTDASDT